MHGNVKNVLPRQSLMTERLLKQLVSSAVRKVQLAHELGDKDLAELISCDPGTISNAREMESKLQAHTLFNLLAVDHFALEGLLHHFGRRSVPIEATCNSDELVSTSAVVASIAKARTPNSDGKTNITDRELLSMESELDDAIESLSLLKMRAVEIRRDRVA